MPRIAAAGHPAADRALDLTVLASSDQLVVGTPEESEVRGKVAKLVALARQQGYTRADLVQMVSDGT